MAQDLQNQFSLAGKVAIVTGASRGIGLAIAQAFAAAGGRVALASRKQDALDQAAQQIRQSGGEALPLATHAGDQAAIARLVSLTVEHYGGLDILVNNAGTNPHFGPLLTAEESQWNKTLDINLLGPFRLAKECVPAMRQRGGGKIINIASIMGVQAQPNLGIYCVSKAGLLMLTQVLALELAADNIQVNAICPGLVKTRFSRALWNNPEVEQLALERIPQRRIAEPQELTGIALYLASPASSYTTGAVFVVDGGELAGRAV